MQDSPDDNKWNSPLDRVLRRHGWWALPLLVSIVVVGGTALGWHDAEWWLQLLGYAAAPVVGVILCLAIRVINSGTVKSVVKCRKLIRSVCRGRQSPHAGYIIVSEAVRVGEDLATSRGATISRAQYMQILRDSLRECTMYLGVSRASPRELLDSNYLLIRGFPVTEQDAAKVESQDDLVLPDGTKATGEEIDRARTERERITSQWVEYFDKQIKRAEEVGPRFRLWRVFVIPEQKFVQEDKHIRLGDGSTENFWKEIVRKHWEHRKNGFMVAFCPEEKARRLCSAALNQITIFGRGRDRWVIELITQPRDESGAVEPKAEVLSPAVRVRVEFASSVYNQLADTMHPTLGMLRPWQIGEGKANPANQPWSLDRLFTENPWWKWR